MNMKLKQWKLGEGEGSRQGLMFGHLPEAPPTMPPADPHSDQTKNSVSFAHTKSTAPTMPPRKRKVTSHWRSFIRPLMWRCKWAELKIKQLESMASSCTETIDQDKHLADQSLPPGFSSTRVNEMDHDTYMSNHVLFSYHENGACATDHFDDLVVRDCEEGVGVDMHNKWFFVEDKDEGMLRKIEAAQTRIQKLKAQLDVVISENVNPFEAQIGTQFGFRIPESTDSS